MSSTFDVLHPRFQHQLWGHNVIEENLCRLLKNRKLHHSLLLTGLNGIGKATLAYRFARYLLSEADGQNCDMDSQIPVFRRIASGGHGDLCVIEPESGKREISVDLMRRVPKFLSQTPMEGGWRVVIIDGQMNRNAANALLKSLEEPPKKSFVILVAESVGQVLPTIRSRCYHVKMQPLDAASMGEALQTLANASPDRCLRIHDLAAGSPGRALQILQMEGDKIYDEIVKTVKGTSTQVQEFCQKYATKSKADQADVFPIVMTLIQHHAYALAKEAPISQNMGKVYESVTSLIQDFYRTHLDRQQILTCLMRAFVFHS
jgi:DNA polymerase-3 subunit delta'